MKSLSLSVFLLLTTWSFSQDEAIINDYVVSPPNRSVVYIIDNPIGRMIYGNWETNPEYNGFNPKVMLVPDLEPYKKKINKKVKKSKK